MIRIKTRSYGGQEVFRFFGALHSVLLKKCVFFWNQFEVLASGDVNCRHIICNSFFMQVNIFLTSELRSVCMKNVNCFRLLVLKLFVFWMWPVRISDETPATLA